MNPEVLDQAAGWRHAPGPAPVGDRLQLRLVQHDLAHAAPGPETLAALLELDPDRLDDLSQVEFLQALDAHLAWLESLKAQSVLAVAASAEARGGGEWARDEVGAALRLSPVTAQRRIDLARALEARLPLTREALRRGRLSVLHAAAVAEATEPLTEAQAAAVEAHVFPRAEAQTLSELRRALRRAVLRVAPVDAAERQAEAASHRCVQRYDLGDGMGRLVADLPAADLETVWLALDARAAKGDPALGVDARRADALTDWASAALADPDLPRRHGRPVRVHVTVDLATLLGLDDEPGELAGYGPLPAPVVRALAAEGEWLRVVTDPVTGGLLDLGRRSYVPSQALVDHVLARDPVCRAPGCRQPSRRCDLDHVRPWSEGGGTDRDNLTPLCRHHHRMKTHGDWGITLEPDLGVTWSTRAGAVRRQPAEPLLA